MESTYIDRLARFADEIVSDAERMDADGDVLASWYDAWVRRGLHAGGGPLWPFTGTDFSDALIVLGKASGAFGFLALQQFVANFSLGQDHRTDDGWPRVGVAFGHLRNPEGPSPIWDEATGRASGFVPWFTGAGIFDKAVLGVRRPSGEELLALVDARDRPEFAHGTPLALIAGAGTRTVSVHVRGLPIEPADVLAVRPPGSQQHSDADGILYQTPLMVGCVHACWEIVRDSPRVALSRKQRCEAAKDALLGEVMHAFRHGAAPDEGARLRAILGDFTVRMARLATMAAGGGGLVRGHPAERLYREALLYSLMAQTDRIVDDAFAEVFR